MSPAVDVVLSALWLLLVVGGWLQLHRSQASAPYFLDESEHALLESWHRAEFSDISRPVLVRVASAACRCGAAQRSWSLLDARWRDRGVVVREAEPPVALPGVEILAFAPGGDLIYAGGLESPGICGRGLSLVDAALAGGIEPAHLLVQPGASCACPTG